MHIQHSYTNLSGKPLNELETKIIASISRKVQALSMNEIFTIPYENKHIVSTENENGLEYELIIYILLIESIPC